MLKTALKSLVVNRTSLWSLHVLFVLFLFSVFLIKPCFCASLDTPGELLFSYDSSKSASQNPNFEFNSRLNYMGKIVNYETGWGTVAVNAKGMENTLRWNPTQTFGITATRMEYIIDGTFSNLTDRTRAETNIFGFEKLFSAGADLRGKPIRLGIGYSFLDSSRVSNVHIYSLWGGRTRPDYSARYGVVFYDAPSLNDQTGLFVNLAVPLAKNSSLFDDDGIIFFIEYSTRDFYKMFVQHVIAGNSPSVIGEFSTADDARDAINAGFQLRMENVTMKFCLFDLNQYRKPVLEFSIKR